MLALTSGDGALAKKMLERDPVAAERGLPLLDLQRLDNEGFSLLDMALSYQHEAPEIATLIGVTQQRQDDAILRKALTATLDTPVLATPLRVRSRL